MSNTLTNQQLQEHINKLNTENLSLIMATVSEDGWPNPSYSPFVYDDGKYYVLISDLAHHTINIKNNNKCSIMLITDESKTKNIFARVRLSYDVTINPIANNSARFQQICQLLQAKTDKTVSVLQTLGDFNLLELTPQKGLAVLGFAKAYQLEGDSINLVRGGHPKDMDPATID